MPKKYSLKFGGAVAEPTSEGSSFGLVILIILIICSCIGIFVGVKFVPKCDDKNDNGTFATTCNPLYENNSDFCWDLECKENKCCSPIKCLARFNSGMISSDPNQIKNVKLDAVNDFDENGNIKDSSKPEGLECNADDGWGPDFNIKRCSNEDKYWNLECADNYAPALAPATGSVSCLHDTYTGPQIDSDSPEYISDSFSGDKSRRQKNNCRDVNLSQSGEGVFGWIAGAATRLTQSPEDQRKICTSYYKKMSGSKGVFCDLEKGAINKCKDTTVKCRTSGNITHTGDS